MRHLLLLIIAFLLACSTDIESAVAKGGRGGGHARSGSSPKSWNHSSTRGTNRLANRKQERGQFDNGPSSLATAHRHERGQVGSRGMALPTQSAPGVSADRRSVNPEYGDIQFRNEQRKLDHRLRTADHLRENAARNGNQNLLDVADRMEQRAHERYDDPILRGEAGMDESPDDTIESGSGIVRGGDSTAFVRHQLNAERVLKHQIDVAKRLRDIAARNGNENLLRTAANMEEMAARRYEQQLRNFGDWHYDSTRSTMSEQTLPAP